MRRKLQAKQRRNERNDQQRNDDVDNRNEAQGNIQNKDNLILPPPPPPSSGLADLLPPPPPPPGLFDLPPPPPLSAGLPNLLPSSPPPPLLEHKGLPNVPSLPPPPPLVGIPNLPPPPPPPAQLPSLPGLLPPPPSLPTGLSNSHPLPLPPSPDPPPTPIQTKQSNLSKELLIKMLNESMPSSSSSNKCPLPPPPPPPPSELKDQNANLQIPPPPPPLSLLPPPPPPPALAFPLATPKNETNNAKNETQAQNSINNNTGKVLLPPPTPPPPPLSIPILPTLPTPPLVNLPPPPPPPIIPIQVMKGTVQKQNKEKVGQSNNLSQQLPLPSPSLPSENNNMKYSELPPPPPPPPFHESSHINSKLDSNKQKKQSHVQTPLNQNKNKKFVGVVSKIMNKNKNTKPICIFTSKNPMHFYSYSTELQRGQINDPYFGQTRNLQKVIQNSMQPLPDGTIPIKFVMIGDSRVGKTTMLKKYSPDMFPKGFKPTPYDNFYVFMAENQNAKKLKVWFWDTAERNNQNDKKMREACCVKADVIFLCFSLVQKQSFKNIKVKYSPQIQELRKSNIILIGTHQDEYQQYLQNPTESKKCASIDKVKAFCNEKGCRYFLTNSKNLIKLKQIFTSAIHSVFDKEYLKIKRPPLPQLKNDGKMKQ